MHKSFSPGHIKRLKQQAKKLAISKGLTHCHALDVLANQQGYRNWSLLERQTMHSSGSDNPQRSLMSQMESSAVDFIMDLDAPDVFLLCMSGSLWVNENDVRRQNVSVGSYTTFGLASDGATRQAAWRLGASLFINFNGLAEGFVFPEDFEPDEPIICGPIDVVYTTDAGRKILVDCVHSSIE